MEIDYINADVGSKSDRNYTSNVGCDMEYNSMPYRQLLHAFRTGISRFQPTLSVIFYCVNFLQNFTFSLYFRSVCQIIIIIMHSFTTSHLMVLAGQFVDKHLSQLSILDQSSPYRPNNNKSTTLATQSFQTSYHSYLFIYFEIVCEKVRISEHGNQKYR